MRRLTSYPRLLQLFIKNLRPSHLALTTAPAIAQLATPPPPLPLPQQPPPPPPQAAAPPPPPPAAAVAVAVASAPRAASPSCSSHSSGSPPHELGALADFARREREKFEALALAHKQRMQSLAGVSLRATTPAALNRDT